MTNADVNQVGAFSLGKGRFDLLIREMWATGTADESVPCSWFECVVGLCPCSTQFKLVVR